MDKKGGKYSGTWTDVCWTASNWKESVWSEVSKGQPYKTLPYLSGKEFDLYSIILVAGYLKVLVANGKNQTNKGLSLTV